MAGLNSLLLVPVVLLIRFLFSLVVLGGESKGVSWSEAGQWHHPLRFLTEEELRSVSRSDDRHFEAFNTTLDAILVERVPGTDGHLKVRQHILTEMNSLGWHVEQDQFTDNTPYGRMQFSNLIATLDPTACRNLVLACHYDSLFKKDYAFMGAIDSAVPCSMLIHAAKVLDSALKRTKNPNITLQLIFFDGEEAFKRWSRMDSLYGSRHLAEKWNKRKAFESQNACRDKDYVSYLDRMDVMVLLDLIGTGNPKFYSFFPDTHQLYLQFAAIEQKLNGLNLLDAKSEPTKYFNSRSSASFGFVEDDHIPFMRRGVPIIHLIPTPFPDVWHERTDNRAALDHSTIDNLNKILRAFILQYLHIDM